MPRLPALTGGSGPSFKARRSPTFEAAAARGSHHNTVQGPTYELTAGEVAALRAYVAELAGPHEAVAAERLLGQLAALAHHREGDAPLRFTPVPAASALAARAIDALRSEGHVRMGGRRWRLHRSRPSRASKRRLAPGSSSGDGAS